MSPQKCVRVCVGVSEREKGNKEQREGDRKRVEDLTQV